MTERQMTPEEIKRSAAAYRQWWLSVLTLGSSRNPSRKTSWRQAHEHSRTKAL
jgi:hypothetical protein